MIKGDIIVNKILRKFRMREWLITLFIIFIIIPFFALAVIYIGVSQNYVRNTYGNYLTQSVKVIQDQIDDSYARFVDVTMGFYNNGLANFLEKGSMSEEDELLINAQLKDIMNSYNGSVTSIYLVHNEKLYFTGVYYQDFVEKVTPYKQKIEDKRGRHIWVGSFQLLPKSKSGIKLVLGKSINGVDEKNIAKAYLVVDIEEFTTFFGRKELDGVSWQLSNASRELLFSSEAGGLNNQLLTQKNGYSILKEDGVNYLMVHNKSARSGWIIDTKIEMNTISRGFESIKVIFWVLAGVYIIFLIVILILLEKYILLPIRVLTDHTDSFAEGRLNVMIESQAIGELKRLNRHFNKMTVRIVELMQRNEHEVKEKNEFKMQTLRAQLSPHFMYNSLNTIKWMAVINKQQNIQDLTNALIQLLMNHTRGKEEDYTLADEILLIENYAIIQKSRFMNFDIKIQIAEDVLECKVTKFLLQPIVENSIIHGFARGKKRRGMIEITAYKDSELHIVVEDNGVGFDVSDLKRIEDVADIEHTHIAVANIQQIIAMEYGDDYGLSIYSELEKGTRVEYNLPVLYN